MALSHVRRCCLEFNLASGKDFRAALTSALQYSPHHRDNIELLPSYNFAECWLAGNGDSGCAVTPSLELISVFSCTAGGGRAAVAHAQSQHDFLHLNCYNTTYLRTFYQRNGFEIIRSEPSFIPGKRDVLFMEWHR